MSTAARRPDVPRRILAAESRRPFPPGRQSLERERRIFLGVEERDVPDALAREIDRRQAKRRFRDLGIRQLLVDRVQRITPPDVLEFGVVQDAVQDLLVILLVLRDPRGDPPRFAHVRFPDGLEYIFIKMHPCVGLDGVGLRRVIIVDAGSHGHDSAPRASMSPMGVEPGPMTMPPPLKPCDRAAGAERARRARTPIAARVARHGRFPVHD